MKAVLFFLLIGFMVFTSCNNSDSSKDSKNNINSVLLPYHINLEKNLSIVKSVPLSSIRKKLEYISLETNSKSLVGHLDRLGFGTSRIVFSDSFIFISDGHKLLQFDRSGKFVRQIGSVGRGPEEYTEVFDFCIDEKKGNIYILSTWIMLEFNFNGQFKRSSKIPFQTLQFIANDTNKLIFYIANLPVKIDEPIFSWYITDMQGNPVIKFKNYHKRVNRAGAIGWASLYSYKGIAHSIEYGSDTLFQLQDSKPEPYAIINLGKVKMDPDPVPTSDRREDFNRSNQKLWPRFINESDRFIYLTLWWGLSDSVRYCVYNKQTQETTFLKNKAFVNDLDGGPSFWPKYIYNDSILVDFIYADKLLEHINKKNLTKQSISINLQILGKELSESSNPILMVLE